MAKKPIPVKTGGIIKFPMPITIIAIARMANKIETNFFMILNVKFIDIQDWDGLYLFCHPRLFADFRKLGCHVSVACLPGALGSRS
jgi:hypothetical protein